MGRRILAGILGGVAFFAWATIAHLATGLAETGVSELPNEQVVVSSMKANIPQSGMYIIPGWGLGPNATHAQRMAAMKDLAPKIKAGPTGLFDLSPAGFGPAFTAPDADRIADQHGADDHRRVSGGHGVACDLQGAVAVRDCRRSAGSYQHQYLVLELVRISG